MFGRPEPAVVTPPVPPASGFDFGTKSTAPAVVRVGRSVNSVGHPPAGVAERRKGIERRLMSSSGVPPAGVVERRKLLSPKESLAAIAARMSAIASTIPTPGVTDSYLHSGTLKRDAAALVALSEKM